MFAFGEKVENYDTLMFNEREVRAAAGIVFLFAFMAFMSGFLTGNNEPTKLMVSVFLFDFFIRIFINPKYSPSMVIGRWIVNNQSPNIQMLHPSDGLGHLGLYWQLLCFIW